MSLKLSFFTRLPDLLHCSVNLFNRHDIPDSTNVWEEKSTHLYIHLFNSWVSLGHVGQSIRHRSEIDLRGRESVHISVHIRFHDCYSCLYSDSNELFQQGPQPVSNIHVSNPRKTVIHSLISNRVNPLYYVTFTTATLCASFILFQGFNTTDAVNTISLLSGFLVIFTGVYLLNLSRGDPDGEKLMNGQITDGVPTDGITGLQTRRSMQTRRSVDAGRNSVGNSPGFRRSGERGVLMHSYERASEDNVGLGLGDLAEDSDEEDNGAFQQQNGKPQYNGTRPPAKDLER